MHAHPPGIVAGAEPLVPLLLLPHPPGAFLVVPAGMSPSPGRDANTAYVYARGSWAAPVMHLPHHSKVRARAWGRRGGRVVWGLPGWSMRE